jgi:hypothetical protein
MFVFNDNSRDIKSFDDSACLHVMLLRWFHLFWVIAKLPKVANEVISKSLHAEQLQVLEDFEENYIVWFIITLLAYCKCTLYITWWICTSHGGYVHHMVDMYITWWICTSSHGGYVHHMVDMYITWWICTISSKEIFIDCSLTIFKELVPPLMYVINYNL